MADNNTKKRYYRKNNYGKFYTYRRIRNIMNTYFRAKISLQIDTVWNNNLTTLAPIGLGQNNNIFSNNTLLNLASSWASYRGLFSFYKPRGLLVEAAPKYQNVTYFDSNTNQVHLPYIGDVALGLNNTNNVPAYSVLVDSNHFIVLSTVAKQRVYWHFTIKDFSELPNQGAVPNAVPYYLCLVQNGIPQNNASLPLWGLRLTYYITFRQSTM